MVGARVASWELALRDVYGLLNPQGAITPELEQQMIRLDLAPPAE